MTTQRETREVAVPERHEHEHARACIIVEDVQKSFVLRHTHSLKETVVAWTKRKRISSRFNALRGLSFVINEGESVAVMGLNGSGKSTLLKLLSGVLQPDAGRILIRGRLAGLIEVGTGFHPDLTGRENIYLNAAILGMSKAQIGAVFDDIVAFSGIGEFLDNEVKFYSSGMFLRLAFAVAIHVELDILLVDEVLAVGDPPFRAKCQEKIRELVQSGKTMVIVSHSAREVKELCSRGIVLRKGEITFDGPISGAIDVMSGQR